MRRFLGLGLTLLFAAQAFAHCPENIDYVGGGWLKRGDSFYYRSHGTLANAGAVYYPNGLYLKRDDVWYYGNGSFLQRESELYYPSGGFLKRDETYYYANGQFLKRGDDFYHPNGAFARRDGKLYRPDGSMTPFPVRLFESIANVLAVRAYVESTSDQIEVRFASLFVNTPHAYATARWDGKKFGSLYFVLNTGVPGENVYIRFRGETYQCDLKPIPEP